MAIPDASIGLHNQSFRMVVRPSLWSSRFRLRISHVFGDRPLALRHIRLALHAGGGACVPDTSVALPDMDIGAGQAVWTQAVDLPWLSEQAFVWMNGRALAFSACVQGFSGPITWHAKSMATSYVSQPGDPLAATDGSETRFPHTTTSTFFIDAVDAWLPELAHAAVAFGDSLTDGTATTLNGHDRWTDVMQRAAWAVGHRQLAVVNAGIGGNQVAGPSPSLGPWRGGPAATDRFIRDVLSLSGVQAVLWLEGINDFSENGNADVDTVVQAMREITGQMKSKGLRVIGATIPSALGSDRQGHGGAEQEARRQAFNQQVRLGQLFDEYADVDAALTDKKTGRLRSEFNGDSTLGEAGDGLHPNRAGHAAIAQRFSGVYFRQAAS
jgi:lysophospholipase L1-like esterase